MENTLIDIEKMSCRQLIAYYEETLNQLDTLTARQMTCLESLRELEALIAEKHLYLNQLHNYFLNHHKKIQLQP